MTAKYYIYRNLRTKGFSVKYRGIVVYRTNCIIAHNVIFKVSKSGRNRVISERRKNVHAYAVADSFRDVKKNYQVDSLLKITYNPYLHAQFMCNDCKIEDANEVIFKNGACYLIR